MYIFISKIKGLSDYDSLLEKYALCSESITHTGVTINFRFDKDNKTIVIDGEELSDSIKKLKTGTHGSGGANAFCDDFMAGDGKFTQNDKTEKNLVRQLNKIITNIVTKIKIESTGQEYQKNYLFIHWGGAGREIYSTRLRNAFKETCETRFIITDFSSADSQPYEVLEKNTIYKVLTDNKPESKLIEKAIKILKNQHQIYSRKVYEIMERIYIRGFPDHIINKPIKIDDSGIFMDFKWLTEQSKNVLSSLPSVTEDRKKDIEQIYKDAENFEKFIKLEGKLGIKITKLKDFRQKINELLNILPFPIYSRDL